MKYLRGFFRAIPKGMRSILSFVNKLMNYKLKLSFKCEKFVLHAPRSCLRFFISSATLPLLMRIFSLLTPRIAIMLPLFENMMGKVFLCFRLKSFLTIRLEDCNVYYVEVVMDFFLRGKHLIKWVYSNVNFIWDKFPHVHCKVKFFCAFTEKAVSLAKTSNNIWHP